MNKVFKRIMAMVLMVTMLFALTTGLSFAAGGTCGDNLSWELKDGKLTISGSGDMDDYTAENDAPWYEERFKITQLVIGKDVDSIGDYAFCGLENLKSADCGKVESIGDYAFHGCTSMDTASLGDRLTYIGDYAFANCLELSEFELPESIEIIGEGSFMSTKIFGNLIFDDSLRAIGAMAFYTCNGITSVTIPDSVETIGEAAFFGCEFIETVTIGEGVSFIGDLAFAYCTDMKSYVVDSGNDYYTSSGDALLTKDKETLIVYPLDKAESVSVPSTVREIGAAAFAGSYIINSVSLPNGLEIIGDMAFADCWLLETVGLPNSLTTIGELAFTACGIERITIPENVSIIGNGAFSDMYLMESFSVASGNDDYRTRSGVLYNSAESVLVAYPGGKSGTYTVLNTVREIAPYAFYGSAVTGVTLPNALETIGDGAFAYCMGLESITVPANVSSIGEAVFAECYELDSITVSGSNTNYTSENGVLFNGDMTTLMAYPIAKSGRSYTVPNGVSEISAYAFQYADITSVTIPNSVQTIGDYAFDYCESLGTVNMGSGVKTIGDYAFSNCNKLTELRLPYGLQTVGTYAFAWNTGLKSVIFEGPTFIDNMAFCWCSSIEDVEFRGAAPRDIGELVFFGRSSDFKITYPKGLSGWTLPTWKGYTTSDSGEATIMPGDVNGDGTHSNSDLVMMARYVVGLGDIDTAAGDMDGNGSVTNADIVALARILVA